MTREWTIVLVDDSPDDRAEIRRLLLRSSGRRYRFREAETGAEGVRLVLDAELGLPDCVVLDYNLPDMVAPEVLAALTGADGAPLCPVVVVTGQLDDEQGRGLLRAGAQDYLGKGWLTADSLGRAIDHATERWATARELSASEARFRHLAAAVPQAIWVTDSAGQPLYVNDRWRTTFGPVVEAPGGGSWERLVHPCEADGAACRSQQAVARGEPYQGEWRLRCADGEYRWHQVNAVPIRDTSGAVTHWYGVNTDIHDRVVARQKNEAAEQRLRLALDASVTGTWTRDLATGVLSASSEYFRIAGLQEDNVDDPAEVFEGLVHPEDRERVHLAIEEAISALGPLRCEFRLVRPNGEVVWVENRGRAVYDTLGEPVQLVGTLTDVSARKRAEVLLRESALARNIVEATGDWMTGLDRDGRVLWTTADGRPAMDPSRYEWVKCWDAPRTRADAELALAAARDGKIGRFQGMSTAGGARRWWDVAVTPMPGTNALPDQLLCVARDVTENRAVEQSLRASEERFARAQQAGHVGTWDLDLVSGESHWTDEVWRLYDRPPQSQPATCALWLTCVHPEDRARASGTLEDALHTGVYSDEFRVPLSDGGVRWLECRGETIYDADHHPSRIIGTVRDVTERRRVEDALRDSQVVTQAVIDGSPAVVYAKDLDGRYFLANRAWLEVIAPGTDPIGQTDEQLFGAEAAASLRETDRMVLASGAPITFEQTGSCGGRRRVWLSSRFPLRDNAGRVTGVGGVSTDITALEEFRTTLASRERELQLVADYTPDILARFDRDLRFVFVNAAIEDATGLPPAACLGKTTRELRFPEALCDAWDAALRSVFASREPGALTFEYEGPHGLRSYSARIVPEVGPDGETFHLVVVTHDVSERRAAEEAMRENDRRKDAFLATLAHELRNPLAPIRSGLQILKHGRDPDDLRRTREMMERQLVHLIHLIDDLLDVSRINTGKFSLKTERVRVRELVEAGVEAARPVVDAGRHVLEVSCPDQELWIDADPTRISQIVSNLLTNAAKYTPDEGRITLEVRREGNEVVMRVSDSGLGIPAEMLDRVFDMFTQVNRTLHRAQGGLGIGLALVQRLVERHGGTITAESPGVGLGSTFTVRLPVALSEAVTPVSSAGPPPAHPHRVLVVDDNIDAARSLAKVLDLHGHQTRVASCGADALVAARRFDPEVVFLDIAMPGMDGYEVARRFRAEPGLSAAVLVALTGWGTEADKRRAVEAGFDVHLTKPVDDRAIARVLDLEHHTVDGSLPGG